MKSFWFAESAHLQHYPENVKFDLLLRLTADAASE